MGPRIREDERGGLVMDGPRIIVVGVTGSGKTTLARQLSERFGVPHVELDALNWEANWVQAPTDVFRERTAEATAGNGWVIDGNYRKTHDITWSRATMVVWLDYPFPLILWRLGLRILRRALTQEKLWKGNQESLRTHLFKKESLILWAFQSYKRRQREFGEAMRKWESEEMQTLRFSRPREVERWLRGL